MSKQQAPPLSSQQRLTFAGGVLQLVDCLKPVVKKCGKNAILYTEEATVKSAGLDRMFVETQFSIIDGLRQLQHNLAFNKTDITKAFHVCCIPRWNFSDVEKKEWAEAMPKCLRNMCTAVQRSLHRSDCASWLQQLPWTGGLAAYVKQEDDVADGVADT